MTTGLPAAKAMLVSATPPSSGTRPFMLKTTQSQRERSWKRSSEKTALRIRWVTCCAEAGGIVIPVPLSSPFMTSATSMPSRCGR
jgi:hypothetical protein